MAIIHQLQTTKTTANARHKNFYEVFRVGTSPHKTGKPDAKVGKSQKEGAMPFIL